MIKSFTFIAWRRGAHVDNRALKNHDEVHDDDVCGLGKDWNESVSFGGKKETEDAVGR